MPELLDGNNLILRLGGGSMETLVSEISELARRRRKAYVIVFDGPPPGHGRKVQTLGPLTLVHSAPFSADEEILRRIRESKDPRGMTVVTDDRALAGAVRSAGARVTGVEAFSREATGRLNRPAQGTGEETKTGLPVSPKEWEKWFSDPRNRLR